MSNELNLTDGKFTSKIIQSMPDIWNSGEFLTSRDEILGALACWAVKQSPYVVPNYLDIGLREFNRAFDPCPAFAPTPESEYFETNCEDLMKKIKETFEKCPTIMGWNKAKKGSNCSRCHAPDPDYGFISLDALARNVSHLITLEAKYTQLHG